MFHTKIKFLYENAFGVFAAIYKNMIKNKKPHLKKLDPNANKYSRGTAAISAGSYGMAGAAILCCKAAALSGAGLIKAELKPEIYNITAVSLPTVVFCKKENLLNKANALLIGPGCADTVDFEFLNSFYESFYEKNLKNSSNNINTTKTVLSYIPMVLDADALNFIAKNKKSEEEKFEIFKKYGNNIIITPHEGEMARLLNITAEEVHSNRLKYAQILSNKYKITTVLKGKNTICCNGLNEVYINKTDSPVLATAGSGDVLSGIIVSLSAQGYSAYNAACLGVLIHGLLGKYASKKYGISTTAENLLEFIPRAIKKLK